MVNLLKLAISKRLYGNGGRSTLVALYVDVEDSSVKWCGRPEGCYDKRRFEWLLGCEKLDGEVFLCLHYVSSFSGLKPEGQNRTTSTLPLPLSLTLNTNESSSPVEGSRSVKNAWCGLLASLSSVVVRMTFSVSEAPKDNAAESGAPGVNLGPISL